MINFADHTQVHKLFTSLTDMTEYHLLSTVLRDTLFCFTYFQLIGPPFIVMT